ncbi:hypothetical protein ACTFIU_004421 [Dictyostelium citrinum]
MRRSPPKPWETNSGGGGSTSMTSSGGMSRPMSGPQQRTISPGGSTTTTTQTSTLNNTGSPSTSVGGPLVTRPRTPMRPWESGGGGSSIDSYGGGSGYRSSYGGGYRDSYSSGGYGSSGYGSSYGSGGYGSSLYGGGGYSSYGSGGGYGSSYGGGGYGSSYGSGYGGYGSSYGGGYGSSYGGGYGSNYGGGGGYGGYGQRGYDNMDGKGGALQSVVSSGHSWMEALHSIVDTFSRFSRLLDANFDAVHGSFSSIIRLCQSMSHFSYEIMAIIKTYSLFRMFQSVASRFLRVFRYLLGKKSKSNNSNNNNTSSIKFGGNAITDSLRQTNMDVSDFRNFQNEKKQSVGTLILIIAATFIGVPMVIGQLLNLRRRGQASRLDKGWEEQPSGGFGQVKAIYEFNPETTRDLPLRVGDIVNVIDKPHDNWWVGECNGLSGFFPVDFTEKISPNDINNNYNNNINTSVQIYDNNNNNNGFNRNNSDNNLNNNSEYSDYSSSNNNNNNSNSNNYQLQSSFSSNSDGISKNNIYNNNDDNQRPISPSKTSQQLSRSEFMDKPYVEES